MKISSRALAYVSILAGVSSTAAVEKCLSGSFILEYEGDCNRETLVEVFDDQVFSATKTSACDGVTAEAELDAQLAAAVPSTTIEELCASIYSSQPEVPFTDILKKNENMTYEKAFFLGHSALQEEVETTYEREDGQATSVLKEDGELVRVHYQGSAQSKKTEWPQLPNFASSATDSNGNPTCTTSAAMCCWTKDRQAADNNGNCNRNTYSQNCVDKDPGDNTNLCYVDMDRGEASTGIAGDGMVTFPENDEGAIHCHGLAWANDVTDSSARYKGNNLFFVSMYDHMYQRGYVENVPGAPMCGCVEQMPTVTRSDCTEIDATERFKITYDSSANTVEGSITLADINFNACQGINNRNNDLWAYMGRLYYEGKIENTQWGEAGRVITNSHDCKAAVRAQYDKEGLEYGYDFDMSTFTFVAGKGELELTGKFGHEAFYTSMFEHSLTAPTDLAAVPFDKTPVLMRACAECADTHKKVFYRRLTAMPAEHDLLYCITETRGDCSGNNRWNEDFTLHSTYEDAVSGENPWKCPGGAFNYGAPFDGECSPTGARVRNQWTVLHWTTPPQKNVGFYVNMPDSSVITEVEPVAEGTVRIAGDDEFVSEDVGLDIRVDGRVRLDEDGRIYVTGAGHNVWHNNDGFQYYYKEVSGDFDVTVNVASFRNIVNSNAKAGIMLRATTDHNSEYVYALLSGGKGLRYQTRSSKGNWSYNLGTFEPNPHRSNVWLRLVKQMEVIDMYWSEDGNTWTKGGSMNMFFPDDTFLLGLAVCSHDSNWQAEATFDNFVVNNYSFPSAAPSISAAPTTYDPIIYVGDTQENVEYIPGDTQIRVKNDAGSGIDGDVDSFFYYAYQRPSSAAFEAVMSVDYFYGSSGAKGGIMVRDGSGASASNAFIGIYPADNTGVIFQSRATEGGDTVRHKSIWVPNNKAFIKLSYDGSGTLVAKYKALETDPVWEDIENGTINITFESKVLVGVAVTGGGYDKYVDFRYSKFELNDL